MELWNASSVVIVTTAKFEIPRPSFLGRVTLLGARMHSEWLRDQSHDTLRKL